MENRRGKDNEISRRMWKTIETKAKKVGVGKTKERRKERRRREEKRREGVEKKQKEKTKKEKDNKSKENSRRMGDLR